ncbi:DUF3885 domain-containing protein [Amycolatopsis plumensis]|uniref:DUF3885 domain-containing protein n=1 Tax=Amycolatopsis plumensis TaxID=236508 RepID=A0ABV5UER1_9PSEU
MLHRYNTVLDELFHGQDVRIVTADWSDASEPPAPSAQHALWNPGARHRKPWRSGLVDDLLRAAADYAAVGVMIASSSFDRIHHPYDSGADVLLPTIGERDTIKHSHADWLSEHPSGY